MPAEIVYESVFEPHNVTVTAAAAAARGGGGDDAVNNSHFVAHVNLSYALVCRKRRA